MIRPLHDRVLVTKPDTGETIEGGIVIPQEMGEGRNDGWWVDVLAVGSKCKYLETDDKVFLPRFSGHEVDIGNGKKGILTREYDIVAKME